MSIAMVEMRELFPGFVLVKVNNQIFNCVFGSDRFFVAGYERNGQHIEIPFFSPIKDGCSCPTCQLLALVEIKFPDNI